MTSAIDIGIAGLRAAEVRVGVRASNIVNWQSENYRPAVPVQTSEAAGPVVKVTRPADFSGNYPEVDLVAEIVDMNLAKQAYKASAAIIRTADDMQKTLLDALA